MGFTFNEMKEEFQWNNEGKLRVKKLTNVAKSNVGNYISRKNMDKTELTRTEQYFSKQRDNMTLMEGQIVAQVVKM